MLFELWCWRRLLRVPWTARRSNQSILKEICPGCSLEGLMLKAETPILGPPDAKSWLIWKDPNAGKDWGQEEKGTTEDEMVGWHHWLNGHGSGWTPGVGDGQGGLACCGSRGRKESDMTEWLDWTELIKGNNLKNYIYIHTYIYMNQCIIHLKLIQHSKSTIFQINKIGEEVKMFFGDLSHVCSHLWVFY